MRKIIVMLVLLLSNLAWAQQGEFIDLGKIGGFKVYVASGGNANRVGNSVLTYVHHISATAGSSIQYLMACDARWLSESIRSNFVASNSVSPQGLETMAKGKSGSGIPLEFAHLYEWEQRPTDFAVALKPFMRALCGGAAPEPKDVVIPIGEYVEVGEKPSESFALLTGTAVRNGNMVDAWIRVAKFKLEPTVLNGMPWMYNGVAQTHKVATGAYEMLKTVYDCSNRLLSVYQKSEYDKDGRVTNRVNVPREPIEFWPLVPNSVGEQQVDAICKIYGGA